MGNEQSQLSKDWLESRKIAEKIPTTVIMDTENDANIYAKSISELDAFVEVAKHNDKFTITKYLMPPLWLGVYELHNSTIMAWFQRWAEMNGYVTSIHDNIIAIGQTYSFSLSPGIPRWYRSA